MQYKEIKGTNIRKEEIKLSLFTGNIYRENLKSKNKIACACKFSKVTR